MDDIIYRQAAIDVLDVLCQEHRYKIPGKRETYSQYNEAWQDALDRAEAAIFSLPSAQPETEERTAESAQNVQNGELISKKAALDALKRAEALTRAFGYHYVIDTIQELPSAQPEITNEAAVEYLQSTGWMQQHDREMYEMGLKARLADDSDSYDALAEPHIGGGEQDETDRR